MNKLEKISCLNPFIFNGRYIKKIIFFDDSGVICENARGWFGNNNIYKNGLEVPEIASKKKIDLSIKKCFYVPTPAEWYEQRGTKCADLYLYIDGEKIKFIKSEKKQVQINDRDLYFYNIFNFSIFAEVVTVEILEKIESTAFGEYVEEVKKNFESDGIKLDSYIIASILRKYNIIKKESRDA